ncbi:MAG: GNAT family N-acetyltransferase [Lachnospiraceae bacterium]|nr:GNAT family N-acetyltransferase [Lachnospiraceae bacterium]
METIRRATYLDKEKIKALWKICFEDTEIFTDWFFENRFLPEYTACIEKNNEIICAMQSYPFHMKIRDSFLPAAIIAGVSTDPAHSGKGYMRKMFTFYMNMISNMGIALVPHTPANHKTFFSLEHYTVADWKLLKGKGSKSIQYPENIKEMDISKDITPLLSCYQKSIYSYSGIISRSCADFRLKASDYLADKSKCLAVFEKGVVDGYAIYFDKPENIHCEEIIALSKTTEKALTDALVNIASDKELSIKLSPYSEINYDFLESIIEPHSVLGVSDVSALLGAVGKNLCYTIEVKDPIVEKNNGIFDFKGKPSTNPPDVSIGIGRLCQWLTGYKSLYELRDEGLVIINNKSAGMLLNEEFPKIKCRIIDEY